VRRQLALKYTALFWEISSCNVVRVGPENIWRGKRVDLSRASGKDPRIQLRPSTISQQTCNLIILHSMPAPAIAHAATRTSLLRLRCKNVILYITQGPIVAAPPTPLGLSSTKTRLDVEGTSISEVPSWWETKPPPAWEIDIIGAAYEHNCQFV
jgi:hypothetical protein